MIRGAKQLRNIGYALYTFLENNPKYILYALIIFMTLFYTVALHVTYHSFTGYNSFDKAIMYQIFWNALHGNFFYSSINGCYYFAGHQAWIFLLFFPFYAICPHPITLSVISSLLISLGALPVYWLAREKLGNNIYALFFAIIYLMYPPLSWMYVESIKAEIFAAPLLLFTFYYFQKDDFNKFLIFMLLSLMCKENIPLVIIMFGIYALLDKKDKKWVIIPVIAGLFCFILEFNVIMPYFMQLSGNPFPVGRGICARYGHLGHNFTEFIKTIILHPLFTLEYAFTWQKIRYIYLLLLPLAFLPLLRPKILLIAIPIFAQNLLSNTPNQYSIHFHYNAVLVAILIIATIYAFRDIADFFSKINCLNFVSKKTVLPLVLMAVLICSSYSVINFGAQGKAFNAILTYQETDEIQMINKLVERIPSNASVSADVAVAPHLSFRKHITFFPQKWYKCDYVLDNPTSRTPQVRKERYYKEVFNLITNENYKIIASSKNYFLFCKREDIVENKSIKAVMFEKSYFKTVSYLTVEEQKILLDTFAFQEGSSVYPKNDLLISSGDSIKVALSSNWHGLEHWHGPFRWTSNNATLFIYSLESKDCNLSSRVLHSFYKPRTLQVFLNDELIHEQKIQPRNAEVKIPIKLKQGVNIIRFYTPDGCQRPCDIPELKNKDNRCLSLAYQNITIMEVI